MNWLAEWFIKIPTACEVCDSGDPVVAVLDGAETLGLCERCSFTTYGPAVVVRRG